MKNTDSTSDFLQSLFQIRNDILRGFRSDREAYHGITDVGTLFFLRCAKPVSHTGGMLDQGVGTIQRDGQRAEFQTVE